LPESANWKASDPFRMNTDLKSPGGPFPLPAGAKGDPALVSVADFSQLRFFEGLSLTHLAGLRQHTKVSYFDPGEALLREGELANRFYVIVSGRVAIECKVNEVIRIQEIGPGEAAGFSWSFTPETLHFTARAIEPVKAIFFYGTLLREDCELDPGLGYELMQRAGRVLVERMEALADALKKALSREHALRMERGISS
jgi:CRP/FNR family cyclic AMP-dependent transcriptional regulator